jgi:DNA modification methylase
MKNHLLVGDVRETLKQIADKSVHCCVTSPPYWGLRDYGNDGQLGLEPTPTEYIDGLVKVFKEIHRVLRDDGILWLNIGDSYASFRDGKVTPDTARGESDGTLVEKGKASNRMASSFANTSIKHKDIVGIPWRLAFALQADGWYLRQDIIWAKPNPMPESVTDRCTKSHEYIFMLTKSPKYFFDSRAIQEDAKTKPGATWQERKEAGATAGNVIVGDGTRNGTQRVVHGKGVTSNLTRQDGKRNRRSVWTINVKPFKEAHFATFPPELIEPCILSGTSEFGVCNQCGKQYERKMEKGAIPERKTRDNTLGVHPNRLTTTRLNSVDMIAIPQHQIGWQKTCECVDSQPIPATVLDPFFGSGTTGLVAQQFGRNWIGCEINPEYAKIASLRLVEKSLIK